MTLVEDLAPVVELYRLTDFDRDEIPVGVVLVGTPQVGNFTELLLLNPTGSAKLAHIDLVQSGNGEFNLGIVPESFAPAGTAVGTGVRDSRVQAATIPNAVGSIRAFTAVALASLFATAGLPPSGRLTSSNGPNYHRRDVFVLHPGFLFVCESTIPNVAMTASIHWREVNPAAQELQRG